MPYYVEAPIERVVDIHWKKKHDPDDPNDPGEPSDFRQTCGAFHNGQLGGLPLGFSGIYILDAYFLYMRIVDQNPGRLPDKPYRYFPKTSDYQSLGITPSAPYVWTLPDWTVYYHSADRPTRIKLYRNVNIQVFDYNNTEPDLIVENNLEVERQGAPAAEIYPPFFIVEYFFSDEVGWVVYPDPGVWVQARCCPKPGASGCSKFETTEGLPPQPPGWGTFFDPYTLVQYPAPGSTNDPVRPPPIARRRREPAQPVPPLVLPQRL
jgi:hypothetical protein